MERSASHQGHRPLRFLHTADWQLGLRLNFVGGDEAVRLRAQRFDTVRRIGEVAREREVDVVLVAGDVFDDNGVGADTLQQTRDALEAFGDIPVVLLPGNHDPATADSALRRLGPFRANVHVALEREPVRLHRGQGTAPTGGFERDPGTAPTVPAVEIFPCPLTTRHHYDDPAEWLPPRTAADTVRVVVAHGGALSFGEATETPNRIDVDAILARGFDYVALGDWHGLYEVGQRAWYSGAPEATRFKEKRPGHVLLVELDGPGAEPRVEAVPVARTRWMSETTDLHQDSDLDGLADWLDGLTEKSWTLLELSITGQLSLEGRARLDALLDDYAARLAHLRVDAESLATVPTEQDLETLHGEGYLGRAIARLRDGADPADADALRLLYRLIKESV
jgi:DNA repair exonuclease SbcCD nuclease subunit